MTKTKKVVPYFLVVIIMMLSFMPVSLAAIDAGSEEIPIANSADEIKKLIDLNEAGSESIELDISQDKKPTFLELQKQDFANIVTEEEGMAARSGYNPLNAPEIQLNSEYIAYIAAQGQQHIFYLQLPYAGKVTEMLTVPSGLNYDIALYRINPPGEGYTGIASSNYGTVLQDYLGREQVSAIVEAGDYYVIVQSITGYSTTEYYSLKVIETSEYSSCEPNDSLYTAQYVNVPLAPNITVYDDIDSQYDWDFFRLGFAEAGEYRLEMERLAGSGTHLLQIYEFTSGGTLNISSVYDDDYYFYFDFNSSSTYYIRITPLIYVSGTEYYINIQKAVRTVEITQVWSPASAPPAYYPGQRTDVFSGGGMFVVQDEAQVRGIAKDAQGRPVPNALLRMRFDSTNSDYPQWYTYGYTDVDGEFDIYTLCPECYYTEALSYPPYYFRYSGANFIVWDPGTGSGTVEAVIHMYSN